MCRTFILEGPEGLEPSTPGLRGPCSNQLSYGPAFASKNIITYLCKTMLFFSNINLTTNTLVMVAHTTL